MAYNGRHGLADRIKRVNFVELVLGACSADVLIVLAEIEHKAEQRTLRLVADLFRQLVLFLRRLEIHHSRQITIF